MNLGDFTQRAEVLLTDFLVGYREAAPGGEARWTVETFLAALAAGAIVAEVIAAEDLDSSSFVTLTPAGVVQADAGNDRPAHAFVRAAVVAGQVAKLHLDGPLNGLFGLARGTEYFLSATLPGQATPTPPTSGLVQRLGVATASDTLAVGIHPAMTAIAA